MSLGSTEVQELAAEAFTYLYPLVTMDVSRMVFTDNSDAIGHTTPNRFFHVPTFPPADFRDVVRPNFDTLYSSAWLDLSEGPLVVHMPDTADRYYLLPMLDMWTDVFAVPGKRTTGTAAHDFVITPPGWTGELPADAIRLAAPTKHVWVIGRTQTNGPADYDAVHAIQAGITLRTLDGGEPPAARDTNAAPAGLDLSVPPLRLVNSMDAVQFFTYANRLLAEHPAHPTDFSTLARIARIGVRASDHFDVSAAGAGNLDALNEGIKRALESLIARIPAFGTSTNGWSSNLDTMGVYGNFYAKRAAVSIAGLGANPPEDAVYPLAEADEHGDPFAGEKNYVLHFDRDDLPPVDAFWSLTMYDAEGFQTANELDRFAIGDRDALEYGDDGSLEIYIQHSNPGPDRVANWLPAPVGPLGITMRLYAPKPEALNGNWTPPAIQIAHA
ncbi:MAG TPA: DUF1254 domain-containing protein [Microbacteriaceae bacterium]